MKNNKFLKLILILFVSSIDISCKGQDNFSELTTTWYEVKKQGKNYFIVDCGYEGGWINIKNDSIIDHGIMEENTFKIQRIVKDNDVTSFYIDENVKYELSWVGKNLGIIKLINGVDNNSIKYYVNKNHLKEIKVIKGKSHDCITFGEE